MYLRPTRLDDALGALAAQRLAILAGGTDFYPARVGKPIDDDILDLTALAELRGIERDGERLRIGALTTWSDVCRAALPRWLRCVQSAAREVGGVQIQNTATVAGNLCNASPAADGVPALLCLDAQVELASAAGRRIVPLEQFMLGSRKTARRADELVTAVLLPDWGERADSTFLKLGARRYLVISIAMLGIAIALDARGAIARCGIAVGACSPVARRLHDLERELIGQRLARGIGGVVRSQHLAPLTPIDDVRGTAAYRLDAVATLIRRGLEALTHA